MKSLLTTLLAFNFIFSFSQNNTEEKEKKHSVGVFISPGEITYWYYKYTLYSSSPKRLNITPFSPSGVSYRYRLNYLLSFQCAAAYSQEHYLFNDRTEEKGYLYIDYKVSYLNIPLGIRLYLGNLFKDKVIGGFVLQLTGNFDFITKEDIYTRSFPFFENPPNPLPVTINETHSNQFKFNRICPSLSIGHEVVGDNFSFFYGGGLEIPAIYQKKNTQEYFKNIKFSLINMGMNYRF